MENYSDKKSYEQVIARRRAFIGKLFSRLFAPTLVLLTIIAVYSAKTSNSNKNGGIDTKNKIPVVNSNLPVVDKLVSKPETSANLNDSEDNFLYPELNQVLTIDSSKKDVAKASEGNVSNNSKQDLVIPVETKPEPIPVVNVDTSKNKPVPEDTSKEKKSFIFPAKFNSNDVNPSLIDNEKTALLLDDLSKCLGKISLIGHTDDIGVESFNEIIGAKRAAYVRDYLVDKGFDANKFVTSSAGSRKPRTENTSPEGREANRRVVIQCQF